jgi:hypothetical protein
MGFVGCILFRTTTLVEGNDKKWYVMELCEQLEGLIQSGAQFHEMRGRRNIVTFITDTEKDPRVLGFSLVDQAENFPVETENKMLQFWMKRLHLKAETYLRAK